MEEKKEKEEGEECESGMNEKGGQGRRGRKKVTSQFQTQLSSSFFYSFTLLFHFTSDCYQ